MNGTRMGILAAAVGLAVAAAPAPADHQPLGAVDPTAQEQLGIYTLNRVRNDPTAYGTAIGFDLSTVPAQPPLAVNRNLTGSSRFHAEEMFDHHYYAHVSTITGLGANAMAVQNGYDAFGMGLGASWGSTNTMESIARGVNTLPSVLDTLSALVIDKGVAGSGHRVHLMAMSSQFQAHREIGIGIATGTDSFPEFNLPKTLPTRLYALHTSNRGAGTRFLTGVVFQDRNGNLRYDVGEGIGGATISTSDGSTESQPAGGWSLQVAPGTKFVTCAGDGWTARAKVTVGTDNIEIDFHAGRVGGEIAFGFRSGLPAPIGTQTSSRIATGTAPFGILFSPVGGSPTDAFWEFAPVGTTSSDSLSTSMPSPGILPVFLDAYNATNWGSDVAMVVADDPAGAGPGTTLPASRAFSGIKGQLKRNFKLAGKDQAKVAGSVELPAGFVPEGAEIQVCIAGALRTFTLDAKGKAKDLVSGSTLVLKAKYPAGAGVTAGTIAKVTATLKGDLARALDAAGVRDRTETYAADPAPVGIWVSGVGYSAIANLAVKATQGKAGTGTLTPFVP